MAFHSSTIIGVGILAGVTTFLLMPEICLFGIAIAPEASAGIIAGLVKIFMPQHEHRCNDEPESKAEEVLELVFEEVV